MYELLLITGITLAGTPDGRPLFPSDSQFRVTSIAHDIKERWQCESKARIWIADNGISSAPIFESREYDVDGGDWYIAFRETIFVDSILYCKKAV